ncbi:hypothetical protein SAMN05192583_3123 [Sphingomonas gellani]|uniref:Hemolysin-type calcium-binding repeat-containing protein n=1 Tax=Sphingomonas gellani TaxID=1166340 RepID=A0A1H8HWH1_9SPHN|nr:hypothetical protein [Sphingomonas gellani]SEN60325.1 hypothetical protein SAMN05192583_3123 [Sphingomonas gellani]
MIYYLDVALTQSGIDWANQVPIPTSMTKAEYDALPDKTVFVRDGYTIDLSEGTSTGFAYEDIVGRTVNQIRGLFPDENGDYDHTYARVHVAGAGDFTVIGSSAGEDLYGGTGNDTLYDGGNAGFEYEHDGLHGGAGDDTYYITGVDSSVTEKAGEGFDRVYADGFFQLYPDSEVEFVKISGEYAQAFGNNLANIMVGSDQPSIIAGEGGNDTLRSDGADTVFEGGVGNDAMRGGAGVDVFLYYGKEDGRDTISRFGKEDVLVTTSKIADANGDNIITFGSNKALDFTATSSVRITDDTGATVKALEYDGAFTDGGTTYYVYSRVGSSAGVDSALGSGLVTYYAQYQ